MKATISFKRFMTIALVIVLIAMLLLSGSDNAFAVNATFVYHERTTTLIPSCGRFVEVVSPTSMQQEYLRFQVQPPGATDQFRVYYTIDGSTPSGSFGTPSGTTTALTPIFTPCNNGTYTVPTMIIPAQSAGTTVQYIVSTWDSIGGGNEVFGNSDGSCTTAACATVFSYTVSAPSAVSMINLSAQTSDNPPILLAVGLLSAVFIVLGGVFLFRTWRRGRSA